MIDATLIRDFQAMPWEVWLDRRYSPFFNYLCIEAATPDSFRSEGINGQFPIALYEDGNWYSTPDMFARAAREAEQYLKEKDIFTITRQCEIVLQKGKETLAALQENPSTDPSADFREALKILRAANVYIWTAHATEAYYTPLIRKAACEYVPEAELDTFIGDISFPKKKNALALFEDAVRRGVPAQELRHEFAWMKARGAFDAPYSVAEIEDMREKILARPPQVHTPVEIPEALRGLCTEVQELVYFRTLRTDALYELYYRAQPVFIAFAQHMDISSVKEYFPHELAEGIVHKVPEDYALLKRDNDIVFTQEKVVGKAAAADTTTLKGSIAFRGVVRGRVRLVGNPSDAEQVAKGDILVTNMTTPAFISAMHHAAAFVTNEGGITCHAAIIAREMKKPCIIGTKIATQVLKDGDMVEVDAERGIVTKINTRT